MMDSQTTTNRLRWIAGISGLVGLTLITSVGVLPRLEVLITNSRLLSLTLYVVIWGLCIASLIVAAAQPNRWLRWTWAIVLSAALGFSQLYYVISGSELTVYDILSLWSARHEAGRALQRYYLDLAWPLAIFGTSFVLMLSLPNVSASWLRRALTLTCWLPIVPVAMIAGVVMMKNGSGAQALPQQFAPLGVSTTSLAKIASRDVAPRRKVETGPVARPAIRHIVMLVDESVRGDYLDFRPGNPYTPQLAGMRDRLANFGPAASASNCSHYTNALIRLGGTLDDTTRTVTTNPSIWQYARKAGYRTVFIDAQATTHKIAGRLQNFMTVAETELIDRFVSFKDVPIPQLDFELLKVVEEELRSDKPVFIYANKNGAHFPYDHGYPRDRQKFGTGEMVLEKKDATDLITSYRNNIAWTVDEFFGQLARNNDLSETLVVYTSDHGQNFEVGKHMHCSVRNANPREALVPMFTLTGNETLHQRLRKAAEKNWATTTHFQLTPTLLTMMGYAPDLVAARHGKTLFDAPTGPTRFTSGDIFGLFSGSVYWNDIDLKADYLEPQAAALGQNAALDHSTK